MTVEQVHKFWSQVDKHPVGCWEWTGATSLGYGRFYYKIGRRSYLNAWSHRVAYQLTKGEIPAGLQIDHLCRNRACVNPSHLEAVTQKENNRRGNSLSAQCGRKTLCLRGHEFTTENTHINVYGKRQCRKCKSIRDKGYRVAKPIKFTEAKRLYQLAWRARRRAATA